MIKNTRKIVLFLGILLAFNTATAATIYKCKSANGSISYRQSPCENGDRLIRSRDLSNRLGKNVEKAQQRLEKILRRKNERAKKREERKKRYSSRNSSRTNYNSLTNNNTETTTNSSSGGDSSTTNVASDSGASSTNSDETSQTEPKASTPSLDSQEQESQPETNTIALSDIGSESEEIPEPESDPVAEEQQLEVIPSVDSVIPQGSYIENEPDGFNQITNNAFNYFENGWWKQNDKLHNFSFQQAIDAPSSSSGIGRIKYPAGHQGGYVPFRMGITGFDYRRVYMSFTFRISENWQNHPSGVNKLGFMTHRGSGGAGDPGYFNLNSQGSDRYVEIRTQHPSGARNLTPNITNVTIEPGEWYVVEVLLDANGEAHLWVNGVKTTEYTDVNWRATGFDEYKLEPTWGGNTGPTVNQDMYMDIDHIYISGK